MTNSVRRLMRILFMPFRSRWQKPRNRPAKWHSNDFDFSIRTSLFRTIRSNGLPFILRAFHGFWACEQGILRSPRSNPSRSGGQGVGLARLAGRSYFEEPSEQPFKKRRGKRVLLDEEGHFLPAPWARYCRLFERNKGVKKMNSSVFSDSYGKLIPRLKEYIVAFGFKRVILTPHVNSYPYLPLLERGMNDCGRPQTVEG